MDNQQVLQNLLDYAEDHAADANREASKMVGVDNYSDAFNQGRFQAYRDMAKYIVIAQRSVR